MARCPAHDDNDPSLSIRELMDGRVLVHCFAECSAERVLAAIGLEFADLYPAREGEATQRRSRRPTRLSPADLLEIVSHEVTVAALLLAEVLERKTVSEGDWARLAAARARIGQARV